MTDYSGGAGSTGPGASVGSGAGDASTYNRRVQYDSPPLSIEDLVADPVEQWHAWHGAALEHGLVEPNAMTLATVGADVGDETDLGTGSSANLLPDARIVLARSVTSVGISFFTNYESTKSRQLERWPAAAAVFGWLEQHRQVRVRGHIERLSADASDAYFSSRPRGSQIGAWASPQSTPITEDELAARVDERVFQFVDSDVPRPDFWGGWILRPVVWEFWQGRQSRLHDRFVYQLTGDGWTITRLAP